LNLVFIISLSLFISCIWLYYLRLVDVFENEKTIYIGITFIIGAIIPNIIYPIHDFLYAPLGISNSSNAASSFLFFTLAVGLLEELVKLIPVLIVLRFLKKAVNEPVDYIIYACVSALGFAFGENIEYAWNYGHDVLISRSILSVPAHMFFSSLFIYGYVLYKYKQEDYTKILLFGSIGFFAHGIYDFLIDFQSPLLGNLLNILFFMLLISAFIVILNNTLNNSNFYTSRKAVNQEKIRNHLFLLYVIVLALVIICDFFIEGSPNTLGTLLRFVLFQSFILAIIIVRLSRFSIIEGLWNEVKPEFPFYYKKEANRNDFSVFFGLLTVKGESYNDYHISLLFQEEIFVLPLSRQSAHLKKGHIGIIEKKVFSNEQTLYTVKIYLDKEKNNSRHYFLIAKTNGTTHAPDLAPIASLNSLNSSTDNRLTFHEWVVLRKKV
jgi:RsiW-degrading membrane proteinase PrsW (M82 family)